jgi:hypothetical protein
MSRHSTIEVSKNAGKSHIYETRLTLILFYHAPSQENNFLHILSLIIHFIQFNFFHNPLILLTTH